MGSKLLGGASVIFVGSDTVKVRNFIEPSPSSFLNSGGSTGDSEEERGSSECETMAYSRVYSIRH